MFERPTKLDWIVYKLFTKIWNPIFMRKPWLLYGFKRAIDRWIADFERNNVEAMTYDEWLRIVRDKEVKEALDALTNL